MKAEQSVEVIKYIYRYGWLWEIILKYPENLSNVQHWKQVKAIRTIFFWLRVN